MALNPNHTFEDLGEQKCAIVEKNCSKERSAFLKALLELNGYTVVIVPAPPPKAAKAPAEGEEVPVASEPATPELFTVGVTDVTFSPINAVFNRELKTPSGQIVTKDYWKQREDEVKKDEWYWTSGL